MRKTSISLGIILLGLLVWYLVFHAQTPTPPENQSQPVLPHPPPPTPEASREPAGSLIGEKLLRDYASEKTTLKQDLELLRRVNLSFITLVKSHANTPIGCNADLADALRGKNTYKQRFLPDQHPVFNDKGELIDRYKTPLHLHVQAAGQYELRSAGPDKQLWTDDDLAIMPNGKYKTE